MANRTVKDAHSVKGTNPQYLVEKIIRSRIYECKYWKEECFALSAELLVDKAMALKYIGGIYGGNVKPTSFICLILKMLQIQPERDIIVEFIRNEDFKYVRALGATYMRLVGTAVECYKYIEPLYNDYRKIKIMDRQGEITLTHMDEYVDLLLREDRMCDIILPRLPKRQTLEESNELDPRVSALDDDLENVDDEDDIDILLNANKEAKRNVSPDRKNPRDLDKPDVRNEMPMYRRSASPGRRERRERRSSREKEKRHRSPGRREKRHDGDEDRRKRHKGHHGDQGRERHRDRDGVRERHRERHGARDDLDIREANELRARLGMAPLR